MKIYRREMGGDIEIGELRDGASLYLKSDLSPETFAVKFQPGGGLQVRTLDGPLDVRPDGSNTVEIVPRL